MKNIYLYLKTHNVTGLKYLGKTVQNPFTYKGSGTHWKRHIEKHGYDVTTEILFATTNKDEFKKVALNYSDKWNIVESKEFANLKPEEGDGGFIVKNGKENHMYGRKLSTETRKKMSNIRKGEKNSFYNHAHSDDTKQIISKKLKDKNIKPPSQSKKISISGRIFESIDSASKILNKSRYYIKIDPTFKYVTKL